jgi:hypothetical protein
MNKRILVEVKNYDTPTAQVKIFSPHSQPWSDIFFLLEAVGVLFQYAKTEEGRTTHSSELTGGVELPVEQYLHLLLDDAIEHAFTKKGGEQ